MTEQLCERGICVDQPGLIGPKIDNGHTVQGVAQCLSQHLVVDRTHEPSVLNPARPLRDLDLMLA
jgi:hypothetical protein